MISLFSFYRDVEVVGEEAVEEPGDGAEGEEEGEGEGHELGALRPDHNKLHAQQEAVYI